MVQIEHVIAFPYLSVMLTYILQWMHFSVNLEIHEDEAPFGVQGDTIETHDEVLNWDACMIEFIYTCFDVDIGETLT